MKKTLILPSLLIGLVLSSCGGDTPKEHQLHHLELSSIYRPHRLPISGIN